MKFIIEIILLSCFSFCQYVCVAQVKTYSVQNAHSHNDYSNDQPFYRAWREGFGSIEADVFPLNGELYVAHKRDSIHKNATLTKLYLEPLQALLNKSSNRKQILLVDVKENYQLSLALLTAQLQPLKKFFSIPGEPKALTILISGSRPLPTEYKNYPGYIFFDDDLMKPHTQEQWKRVGMVSLDFKIFSKWRGIDTIPEEEQKRLLAIVNSVHAAGKPIRFWGAPDNPTAWTALMDLGVDLIGTDKIKELSSFIANYKKAMTEPVDANK